MRPTQPLIMVSNKELADQIEAWSAGEAMAFAALARAIAAALPNDNVRDTFSEALRQQLMALDDPDAAVAPATRRSSDAMVRCAWEAVRPPYWRRLAADD